MGEGHNHADASTPRSKLLIVFCITTSVFVIEVFGAIITGSLALLVDTAHMLTDVVGLALGRVAKPGSGAGS